jgi:hypothetical protein
LFELGANYRWKDTSYNVGMPAYGKWLKVIGDALLVTGSKTDALWIYDGGINDT